MHDSMTLFRSNASHFEESLEEETRVRKKRGRDKVKMTQSLKISLHGVFECY